MEWKMARLELPVENWCLLRDSNGLGGEVREMCGEPRCVGLDGKIGTCGREFVLSFLRMRRSHRELALTHTLLRVRQLSRYLRFDQRGDAARIRDLCDQGVREGVGHAPPLRSECRVDPD